MLLNKVFNNRYTLKISKFLKYVDKYGFIMATGSPLIILTTKQ